MCICCDKVSQRCKSFKIFRKTLETFQNRAKICALALLVRVTRIYLHTYIHTHTHTIGIGKAPSWLRTIFCRNPLTTWLLFFRRRRRLGQRWPLNRIQVHSGIQRTSCSHYKHCICRGISTSFSCHPKIYKMRKIETVPNKFLYSNNHTIHSLHNKINIHFNGFIHQTIVNITYNITLYYI